MQDAHTVSLKITLAFPKAKVLILAERVASDFDSFPLLKKGD
jgi:hypothetical protein